MLKDRHSQTDRQIYEQTGGKKGRQTDRQSDMCGKYECIITILISSDGLLANSRS